MSKETGGQKGLGESWGWDPEWPCGPCPSGLCPYLPLRGKVVLHLVIAYLPILQGLFSAPRSLCLSNMSSSDCPGSRLVWSTGRGWLPLRGCCGEFAEETST